MLDRFPQSVKISQIIESQIPKYILESEQGLVDFLKQYYISQEYQGGPINILENIDTYTNPSIFTNENLTENTTLSNNITAFSKTIQVESTSGWPTSYGLLKIDDEIITYTGITSTSFTGCIRGFCGVESLNEEGDPDSFVFLDTVSKKHTSGTEVLNLSNLFLKKFYESLRSQYAPGFENVGISSNIKTENLYKYAKDFYLTKGTERSFKILFDIIFNTEISLTKPGELVFTPSDGKWVENQFIIVEDLTGDIKKIERGVQLTQKSSKRSDGATGVVYYFSDIPERSNIFYSKIGFDKETISGNFTNTSYTKILEDISIGDTVVNVDSTVGFPNSGSLVIKKDTGIEFITYSSKTLTQFIGCIGLGSTTSIGESIQNKTVLYEDNLLSGNIDGKISYFAITNLISSYNDNQTKYLSVNDTVSIKSFGYQNDVDPKFTSWQYNIKNLYKVTSYTVLSSTLVKFFLSDIKNIRLNNEIEIFKDGVLLTTGTVVFTNKSESSVNLNFNSSLISGSSNRSLNLIRKISKSSSSIYDGVNQYSSSVQNTYINDENLYVSSSSLPENEIDVLDGKQTFTKTNVDIVNNYVNIPSHNYYNGQLVYYKPVSPGNSILPFSQGEVYIKRISSDVLAFAYSLVDVDSGNLIDLEYDNNTANTHELYIQSTYGKKLTSQNLFKSFPLKPKRKTSNQVIDEVNTSVGLFVNGVEIIHPRSENFVSYGNIESIDVKKSVTTFDLSKAPKLIIEETSGSGAEGIVHLSGSIDEVIVENEGLRFISDPVSEVIGGNGSGAVLETNLSTEPSVYEKTFNKFNVNTSTDTISFTSNHIFRTGDSVLYNSLDQDSPNIIRVTIGSTGETITTNSNLNDTEYYYVGVVSERSVKLFYNQSDALSGINTVNIVSVGGTGNQSLQLNEVVTKISKINVIDGGSNYQNRKIFILSQKYPPEDYLQTGETFCGINTENDYIFAKNHGFSTGDTVEYSILGSGTSISGLSTSSSYFIIKINDDKFHLSNVSISTSLVVDLNSGISTVTTNLQTRDLLNQNKIVKIDSVGVGTHVFKSPEIKVKTSGFTAIGYTSLEQKVVCFGEVDNIYLYRGGSGYGSQEIINYEKDPKVTVTTGNGAVISPIVSDLGEIVDVVIKNSGSNYVITPQLIVTGDGSDALLIPNIVDEKIVSVNIVNPGIGYSSKNTTIDVVSIGSSTGVSLKPKVKKWFINNFEFYKPRYTNNNEGVVLQGLNDTYGNRYVNFSLNRDLRYKLGDNITNNFQENATGHSPIVGWAYDGNPIYGPYGYSSSTNTTSTKRLISGYKKILRSDRPSTSIYPLGFFYDDHYFTNTGDLDENNGRFCVTPEFPNGTYAYFSTLSNTNGSGSFSNNRLPEFPYVIGKSFNNSIDTENFRNYFDENLLDSSNTKFTKNTTPYNLQNYEYLDLNLVPKNKIFRINSIERKNNRVDSIDVINSGSQYKVGDYLKFDNSGTGGDGVEAYVDSIVGKGITSVSITTKTFENVQLEYNPPIIIGFTTIPHNLNDGDVIRITGVRSNDSEPSNDTTDSAFFKNILGNRIVSITTSVSGISTNIPSYSTSSSSGFTTFISINERVSLTEKFQVDGIIGIGTEFMKILNIDDLNNRLRVLRGYNPENPNNPNLTGIAYTTGESIEVKSNKFQFQVPLIRENKSVLKTRSLYFDPEDSVGLGTTGSYLTYEVGIGSTSNQKLRFVDAQRIYLPKHGLKTGDKLLYSPGIGIAVSFSNDLGLTNQTSLGSTVFAIYKGPNYIGLSTNRVGLGETTNNGIYFTGIGSGNAHVITTNFGESLLCDVIKQYATVSVGETHGLSENDEVTLTVVPNEIKTEKIFYNKNLGKLCVGIITTTSSNIGVGTTASYFNLPSHGLISGDRIIYQASNPASPLKNNEQYYVIKVDDNKIRLSENDYDVKYSYSFVNLTSSGSGIHTLSSINPRIEVIKGNILRFDLSDSSLLDFNFVLFSDRQFRNNFVGTGTYFSGSNFETKLNGTPGNSGSYLELYTKYELPKNLFYSLKLKNIDSITNSSKLKFEIDSSISGYSRIVTTNSKFNVTGKSYDISNDYIYYLSIIPSEITEATQYTYSNTNILSYTTKSQSSSGPINSVRVESGGVGYETLPIVTDVISENGTGAQLTSISKNIGKSNQIETFNISYSLPSDFTIKPKLEFPTVVSLEDNYTIRNVVINKNYPGKNYTDSPKIIALDSNDNIINDLVFESFVSSGGISRVSIIQNKTGLSNDIRIVSTNNSNGYVIDQVSFNSSTKIVTLTLDSNLPQNNFVFDENQKIYVEGLVSYSGILTTSGYNSSNHGYELFTIVGVNTSNRTLTYKIDSDSPGNIDELNSSGYVIPESDLVKLSATFNRGRFANDEDILVSKPDGSQSIFKVASTNGWDGKNLKLFYKDKNSDFTIDVNDTVEGKISKQKGIVNNIVISNANAVISASYNSPIGWESENGKLSVSGQKIQDGDYYQKLSYDIKSTLSPSIWKETVDSLNHIAGQKSFASSLIISEPQ